MGAGLVLGHVRPHVRELTDQSQDGAALGQDGQTVEALVALAEAVADPPQPLVQGSQAGVVPLAAVVPDQHDATPLPHQTQGALDGGASTASWVTASAFLRS